MSEENNNNVVMFFKLLAIFLFVYPVLHYTVFKSKEEITENHEEQPEIPINETENYPEKIEKKFVIIRQPSCHISYNLIILQDICKDLYLKHEQCTPEDFHNIEKHKLPRNNARNNNTSEPRAAIVSCVAAGLLLTSLGAAFLELYKAKSQSPVKNTKPTISRKCSLADLTVLKHTRKELVRRESIMEIPENGNSVKQLGFRPPPLYRRCSFPVGPSELTYGNAYNTYQESRRASIESRRLSTFDSRRNSGNLDCRKASINLDNESPERRHWSRLVHRH